MLNDLRVALDSYRFSVKYLIKKTGDELNEQFIPLVIRLHWGRGLGHATRSIGIHKLNRIILVRRLDFSYREYLPIVLNGLAFVFLNTCILYLPMSQRGLQGCRVYSHHDQF